MHLRRIKVLAVVIPATGLFGFELFRHFVLRPTLGEHGSHFSEHIFSAGVLLVAVVAFSFAIFRLLERPHDQLVALNEAAMAVTADLSVERVLERSRSSHGRWLARPTPPCRSNASPPGRSPPAKPRTTAPASSFPSS